MPNTSSHATAPMVAWAGRAGLAVLGVVLVASAWVLPLWTATLHAPQYPGGLATIAYGSKVAGDLNEINALNHYVGLGVFDPSDVPEMRLWPLALGLAIIAAMVAALVRRGWVRRSMLAYLWTLPVGVLAVIQFRLHQFGQAIEPGAAFRLDPFTPWVIGRTTVWNFETWAWPGAGLLALLAAAAVITGGVRLLERWQLAQAAPSDEESEPDDDRGPGRMTAVALLVAILAVSGQGSLAGSAWAAEHDHSGHGSHGHQHDERSGATSGSADHDRRPTIGPGWHADMPMIINHPVAGDLADLIAAVEPGGVLHLPAGTYGGPVVIDQPITIEGQGWPIIQGDGAGSVITIRAPGTVIRGLVVQGSGPGPHDSPAAIRIEADGVVIDGNVIQDSYMGLAVDSAASVKLLNNHIHGRMDAPLADDGHAMDHDVHDEGESSTSDHAHSGHGAHGGHGGHSGHGPASSVQGAARGDGIWLHDVDHVLVRGNHIMGARDGVYVSFGSGTLIDSNHIHASRYAFHTMFARDLTLVQNHAEGNLSGAVLMYGQQALLLRNHIERNVSPSTGFGIILKDITAVDVVENLLVDNRIAVHLDGPTEATFTANTIARSDVGLQAHSSAKATFAGNSFVHNAIHVRPLGSRLTSMTWTDRGFGNFWDTYRGYDGNGDGLGSVPHVEGGAVDRLLSRNPELIAIAHSPAMRMLRSVEERWGQRAPALVDPVPLMQPISPPLATTASGATVSAPAAVLGLALVLPALIVSIRPRHRRMVSRRSTRVVTA